MKRALSLVADTDEVFSKIMGCDLSLFLNFMMGCAVAAHQLM